MTIELAFISCIVITLTIVGLALGYFPNIWFVIKRTKEHLLETQKLKKLNRLAYPRHLRTDDEINLYIKKNYKSFPNAQEWGSLLVNMIREMTIAGWNTEIPIYVKYKYGTYQTHLIMDNQELRYHLYQIAHKYEEIYDAKKL